MSSDYKSEKNRWPCFNYLITQHPTPTALVTIGGNLHSCCFWAHKLDILEHISDSPSPYVNQTSPSCQSGRFLARINQSGTDFMLIKVWVCLKRPYLSANYSYARYCSYQFSYYHVTCLLSHYLLIFPFTVFAGFYKLWSCLTYHANKTHWNWTAYKWLRQSSAVWLCIGKAMTFL